jgi:hypothetical protein
MLLVLLLKKHQSHGYGVLKSCSHAFIIIITFPFIVEWLWCDEIMLHILFYFYPSFIPISYCSDSYA